MAKKFRFNLEPVLRYRQLMEDQKRREFAEANRLLEEERVRRENIQGERSEMQDEIVRSFEERAPFQSIVTSYHLVGRLEQSIVESKRREIVLDAEREKRRQALIDARRRTRMMELLKERRQEEYRIEMDKREQTLLDELSIQDRSRKSREEGNREGTA